MLVELFVLVAIIYILHQRWVKRDLYKLGKQLSSGLWSLPILGHAYLFLGDNQRHMKAIQMIGLKALRKDNGLTAMWLCSRFYVVIADPEAAEVVLRLCLEKDEATNIAAPFLGSGSIFAPVPIWRPRRKVLGPVFGIKTLKQYMSAFVKQSNILVQQLKSVAGSAPFASWSYFTAYTMDSISELTLGYEMNSQKNADHPFLEAFNYGFEIGAKRIVQPWLQSDLIFTRLSMYTTLMNYKKYMWGFIDELIKSKRNEIKQDINKLPGEQRTLKPFMELLITASGGDEGYTNLEVIEEVMVILLAGNDTSAVATSFVAVMLSRYPDVQNKVYEELQELFRDSNRPPTFEDLSRLVYLDAVIKETLRLYPPVPAISRKVEKNTLLPSGINIVPGVNAVINIWALHRNPRYWGDDADLFRPERFLDTPLKHPAAYMPFSFGPRNCVGYQYTMMSMKTVMSTLLRHYKILPATKPNSNSEYPPLRLKYEIMMKDMDNFQIQLESRH